MKRMARAAVIGALRDALDERGSWTGETHIQKSTFFLQDAANVPLGYEFVLYKHGPFSFALRDDLSSFRADGLIGLVPQAPYGPRLLTTPQGKTLQKAFPRTLSKYSMALAQVAEFINSRGVGELERLGTALLFINEHPGWDDYKIASEICKVKPHVAESSAREAVSDVRQFLNEVQSEASL